MKWRLSLSNEDGTTLELSGNHLGTIAGQGGSRTPSPPLGGGVGTSPTQDLGTATSNLYGMTDDELLDCLGPSWRAMSDEQRRVYPRRDYHVFLTRRAS